jgi:hypothetical protein
VLNAFQTPNIAMFDRDPLSDHRLYGISALRAIAYSRNALGHTSVLKRKFRIGTGAGAKENSPENAGGGAVRRVALRVAAGG